jgi:hypothetical protein
MRTPVQRRDRTVGLAETVKAMREHLLRHCGEVAVAIAAGRDLGDTPPEQALRKHLDAILSLCGQQCDHFNKLRSIMAEVERVNNVAEPAFYIEPYELSGVPNAKHGSCVLGGRRERSVVDLSALKPADSDLAPKNSGAGESKGQDGHKPDDCAQQDDANGSHALNHSPSGEKVKVN